MKALFKIPTLQDIQWCTMMRGCLFPVNQGSLFFASQIEDVCKEHNIFSDSDLQRKKEIENVFKFGFFINEPEDVYLSENIVNTCYNIILSGVSSIDIETPVICPIDRVSGLREEELRLVEELRGIHVKMSYMKGYSYEAVLERMYNYFMLSRCILKEDMTPVFKSGEDVFQTDPLLVNLLFQRLVEFRNYIPERVFRYIARGDGESGKQWSALWYSMKAIGDKPFDVWDENKMSLCRWTERYDNIRTMSPSPPEDILSNDAKLDNWLFTQKIEKKKPSGGSSDEMVMENKRQEKSFVAEDAMTFEVGD